MGRQTDAKGRQTDAMGRQTDAMWRQTCAEGRNRATWCAMGRQTDAMGRQTDAMGGRPTLCEGRSALVDAIGRHMLFLAPETVSELIFIFRGMVMFLSQILWVELILNGDAALLYTSPHHAIQRSCSVGLPPPNECLPPSSVGLPASNARAPAVSACLPASAQCQRQLASLCRPLARVCRPLTCL